MIVNDPNDQSFDKAIELDPDSGLVYVKRAGIWSAKGDVAKMQLDLDEAIKRSPEDPEGCLGPVAASGASSGCVAFKTLRRSQTLPRTSSRRDTLRV